jgi:hypothetical protein
MSTATEHRENRPAFLVTIDTEADNLWSRPRYFTTRNSRYLPRFQSLCERHGLKPTYLTDWSMANCPVFRDFAQDALRRGRAEIGMHLHAWNSPPLVPLTADDLNYQPFLIEHAPQVIREKIKVLTSRLEETFGVKMRSHRSGRWSFSECYAQILIEQGYGVDCSVTPHVSWRSEAGGAARNAGTDFSRFMETAYLIDPADISRPLNPASERETLLEVPMTIMPVRPTRTAQAARRALSLAGKIGRRVARGILPTVRWLRPNGRNGSALPRMLDEVRAAGRDYAEFMLHSSELMPGGSPTFGSVRSVERLYRDLDRLFEYAGKSFAGTTLSDYAAQFRSRQLPMAGSLEVEVGSEHPS